MADHAVNSLMTETMEKIRSMVDVNTIIGDPIVTHDGTTLIPISKVTFGFGSGGTDFRSRNSRNDSNAPLCFGGGGGAGVSVTPVAFLIVNGDNARILPVNMPASSSTDRLIEMIPDAVDGIQNFLANRRSKKEETKEETSEE